MGTIKVHEFMTLDGCIGEPTFTFDFEFNEAMIEDLGAVTSSCEAILLGRKTYEMFYPAWSTRTAEDDPGAPFFNDTPKYVVSSTLQEGPWNPTTILGPYNPETIRKFKDSIDGGIYISGSVTLVQAMLDDGLIDELHLVTYPVALGKGPKLFPEGSPEKKLELGGVRDFGNGVAHLFYKPVTP